MHSKLFILIPIMGLISACSSMEMADDSHREWVYPVDNHSLDTPYNTPIDSPSPSPLPHFVKTAEAPQTPMSAKNMDVSWVQQQSPTAYTIQVANHNKPLEVSQVLMELPKGRHSAELKYQNGHEVYYTGLYGSYNDQAMAEESLKQLPADIQAQAKIIPWRQVQGLNYL